MIKARAERFICDGRAADNVDIPDKFWWAEGQAALVQDWKAGDFDTWIDHRIRLQAFGVTFRRSDIERLRPQPFADASSTSSPAKAPEGPKNTSTHIEESKTVFISYSHDSSNHVKTVLLLSNKLRADGVDCVLDQYESCPPEGWPRWMDREINKAEFVLMICTQAYYLRVMCQEPAGVGLGIAWEGNLIYNHIYKTGSLNAKFITVIFLPEYAKFIPTPIQGATRYCLNTDDGYEQLYNRLTGC